MVFLEDHRNRLTWAEMTDAQRLSSITATGDLHWIGPEARTRSSALADGVHPSGHLEMYAPDPMEQGSSITHWTTDMAPDELMEPFATTDSRDLVTTGLLLDIGWQLAGAGDADPPPPPGPWLSSSELPGFEAKARITPRGGTPIAGSSEPMCIIETLCVSGSLEGRPEVFLKVIGPRPNGFLWVQISRFTPSEVEVWMRQISTGQINYYRLDSVGPGDDDVSGRQDREAFVP